MSQQEQVAEHGRREKAIEYFVNGEKQETDEKKLEAKTILADAGFEPTAD